MQVPGEEGGGRGQREAQGGAIERFIALQFLFDKQWKTVKVRSPSVSPYSHL